MASNSPPTSHYDEVSRIHRTDFSIWQTFKRHLPHVCITIIVDIILPLLIFFGLQKQIKPVYALLLAGTPPLIMVIFKGFVSRRFDALGFIVFIGFIVSGIVAIITRNAIVLLLEKSIDTGTFSIIFALTLIPFHLCCHRCRLRPLAYYFYEDLVPTTRAQLDLPEDLFENPRYAQSENDLLISIRSNQTEVSRVYEWLYKNCSAFRRYCHVITGIWAIGLLSEFLGRLILILVHLSVTQIVLYGNVIFTTVTILCIVSTMICVVQERKQTMKFIRQWRINHLYSDY